jgi:hypothetical protein
MTAHNVAMAPSVFLALLLQKASGANLRAAACAHHVCVIGEALKAFLPKQGDLTDLSVPQNPRLCYARPWRFSG